MSFHPKPPLCEIFKNVEVNEKSKKSNWHKILKKETKLRTIGQGFSRKNSQYKKSEAMQSLTQFFVGGTENFEKLKNSAVQREVDKITENLLKSRQIFELRNLKPKRKMDKLRDCKMSKAEIFDCLEKIFSIFHLKTFFGETNCEMIQIWIKNVILCRQNNRPPIVVFKQFPVARSFRSKDVLNEILDENELKKTKRGIQLTVVNNTIHSIFWWILAALRQVIIPINSGGTEIFYWRFGYLKFLKIELEDFWKRYHVRRITLDDEIRRFSTCSSPIGRLRFTVVRNKLRPVFPRQIDKKSTKFEEFLHWKRINSMISWILEQNGIERKSIHQSCQLIHQFLNENQQKAVHGFTLDITKCFSTVDHHILIRLLESLMHRSFTIFSVCGFGRLQKGQFKIFCCVAQSRDEAIKALEEKMKGMERKNIRNIQMMCSSTLLKNLRSIINSYMFCRGKTTWKVTRGVPQGHPLSSNFSHLYLTDFERTNWKFEMNEKKKRMVYCRYEDDYIFCTTQKSIVEQMSKPLFSGENAHKLVANQEKSQYSTEKLSWCGIRINFKNGKFKKRQRHPNGILSNLTIKFQN